MKHKLLSLLGIFAMTVAFFSCSAEVGESEPQPTYYTVTYSSEYGTTPSAISVEENTVLTDSQLPALSDGTLVFKGWFDGETKAVAGEYQVTGNVTLTAHWASTATVSYHSKFGTVPESFDVELNQTLTAGNLAEISCSPYTFLGWYYSKDEGNNGTGTQAQAGDEISADTPLYAKWETATVSFSSAYGTVPSIKKYTGEKLAETEIPTISRTGYSLEWFNGSTKLTTNYTVNGDVTFTEKWTPTYDIIFKANGGSGADYTQTVTYGTTTKLNANTFTHDGYAFNGWNKAADGSGTAYANEADFAVTEANDVTLYAQWDPIADETTIVDMIKNMTESGTIAAKGTFSTGLIRQINSALKALPSNVCVFLDLSNVTGLTKLEDASDSCSSYSFYRCSKLSGIILPDGVTSIGESAFYGCSGLTSITIPDGVTSIEKSAFYGCSSLTSITIPDGVTSIGESAFYRCRGLTSITIPDGVTSIENSAFSGCSGLTSITIPDGVTSIGNSAFSSCSGLTSITIPDGVTSIGNSTFYGCSGLTSITIPDGVTSIEKSAFYGCSSLTSITIPDGVTSIGESAFYRCRGLTSITIPDGVTSIENSAFSGCSGLTSITIPDGVTSIGNSAFSSCSGLTSITIPDGVTSIGESAFSGCSGLTRITISAGVTSIGASTFKNCSHLTSITISGGVTSIESETFSGCRGLTSITIPGSVTSIESQAFRDCSGLTSITIPDGVTSIGVYAFNGCKGLTSITIPDSVTSIGYSAFFASKLTNITFADTESAWEVKEGMSNNSEWTDIGVMSATDTAGNATLLTLTYSYYNWRKKQ